MGFYLPIYNCELQGCKVAKLQSCNVACICMVTKIHGYKAAKVQNLRFQGRKATKLQSFMAEKWKFKVVL